MKYALIQRHKQVWPIRVQCRVLRVRVSGYHQHPARCRNRMRLRHLSEAALLVHIRAVDAAHRGAYGWPRVWRQLRAEGVRVGKRRVQRLMRKYGIRARGKKRFRVTTTDSRHSLPVAPNLLQRNFAVTVPNTVWVGDVTYIPTAEGWLYLAVVIDLFSGRIVGWSMRTEMTRELVMGALDMAWYGRFPGREAGLIFHSDRGSQYACSEFRELPRERGIRASMSRRGDCWDNACAEALFGSLKVERLHGEKFATRREAQDVTLEWLLWYNQSRLHSTLGYVSPARFELDWNRSRPASGKLTRCGGSKQAVEKWKAKPASHFPTATTTAG